MRLVDADALKKAIPETTVDASTKYRYCVTFEREDVLAIIDDAPTVDIDRPTRSQFKRMAVQLGYEAVIRCKNCVHWQKFNDDMRRDGMCEALLCFHGAERNMTNEDFFCAYGERRADFVDDNKIGERRTDEQ